MAITNLQQARQLYATGQRVAKTLDGSRPGYKGGADAATASFGESIGYSEGPPGGSGGTGRPDKDLSIGPQGNVTFTPGGTNEGPDFSAVGPDSTFQKNTELLNAFKEYKPPVKTPPFGIFKFLKKPIQMFSDFTTGKNRAFFEDVIRAGKLEGVTFADLQNPNFNLENAYQNYMRDRSAGKIDAYGNPLLGYGEKDNQGIASMYNPNMFVDDGVVDDSTTTDLFTSRFLQNQPDQIRQDIEEQMQNYYTV